MIVRLRRVAFAVMLAAAAASAEVCDGEACAVVEPERIVLENGLVEREWTRVPFRTLRLDDLRTSPATSWSTPGDDFAFALDGAEVAASAFGVTEVRVQTS